MLEKTLTDNSSLSRSILGTTDAREVHQNLNIFCEKHLGSGIDEMLLFRLSVGASFGLLLYDGRRIFLKAHPTERPSEYLEAVHRVQDHLHYRGFPCPRPVLGPRSFGTNLATVDEFVDKRELPDGRDPRARREMAEALVRQINLAGEIEDIQGLDKGWPWPKKDELWPPPHSPLFDFEATAKGAEWIDESAAKAKTIVDNFNGPVVAGHTDWSADQIRMKEGKISVVYDWDSLRPEKEVVIAGIAAANFTSAWSLGVPNPPSPEETLLFIEDYEKARGGQFSEAEHKAVSAAAIYAVAYIGRCEHAVDMEGRDFRGSFREALPLHRDDYFEEA